MLGEWFETSGGTAYLLEQFRTTFWGLWMMIDLTLHFPYFPCALPDLAPLVLVPRCSAPSFREGGKSRRIAAAVLEGRARILLRHFSNTEYFLAHSAACVPCYCFISISDHSLLNLDSKMRGENQNTRLKNKNNCCFPVYIQTFAFVCGKLVFGW